ncbi:DUF4265 domain-containing protein [Fulvivirga maritima]|uniref:DUF4265 domain-containing protein n=1 Tax=Fulvivirga maritima TaxID=2904247 RepID=UPI001F2E9B93|nr:DUF4265 domain-containing protein [Fulvivirga maritima]UII25802.1 DUF4265 domain-containing protein [Fulvivirga maritima]
MWNWRNIILKNHPDNIQVKFVHKLGDNYEVEELACKRMGKYYEVNNIPFFIHNIALGDIISVEKNQGYWYDSLIKESGASLIQVVALRDTNMRTYMEEFKEYQTEMYSDLLISISINPYQDYKLLKKRLESGLKEGIWDYKEASLSKVHRENVTVE